MFKTPMPDLDFSFEEHSNSFEQENTVESEFERARKEVFGEVREVLRSATQKSIEQNTDKKTILKDLKPFFNLQFILDELKTGSASRACHQARKLQINDIKESFSRIKTTSDIKNILKKIKELNFEFKNNAEVNMEIENLEQKIDSDKKFLRD